MNRKDRRTLTSLARRVSRAMNRARREGLAFRSPLNPEEQGRFDGLNARFLALRAQREEEASSQKKGTVL